MSRKTALAAFAVSLGLVTTLLPKAAPAPFITSGPHLLVGEWSVTAGSRLRLLFFSPFWRAADSDHLIVLNPAGQCQFRSHWQYSYTDPDETEDDAYFDTTDCTWRSGQTQVRREGQLHAESAVIVTLRQGHKAIDSLYVIGMRGVWQRIGEPWMSAYMEFERRR